MKMEDVLDLLLDIKYVLASSVYE